MTIYALQVFGLRTSFFGVAESNVPTAGRSVLFEMQTRASDRHGMSLLASQTGGRLVANRNRFDGELLRISEEMTGYYSLAYVPPHGGDGGDHRIDVDVDRASTTAKKVRVRHRRGYRDKTPDERLTERLQSALYLGLGENPHAARLGAGMVREGEDGLFVLPLHVLVPAESVVFLPGEDGEQAELRLKVASRDTAGKVTFEERTVKTVPPEDGALTLDVAFELELGTGVHVLAVALRDEVSRETSFVSTAVEIVEPEAQDTAGS